MQGLNGIMRPDLPWLPCDVALVIVGGDGLTWLADRSKRPRFSFMGIWLVICGHRKAPADSSWRPSTESCPEDRC